MKFVSGVTFDDGLSSGNDGFGSLFAGYGGNFSEIFTGTKIGGKKQRKVYHI